VPQRAPIVLALLLGLPTLAACAEARATAPTAPPAPSPAPPVTATLTTAPPAEKAKSLEVLDGVRRCDRLADCRAGVFVAVAEGDRWAAAYPGSRLASEADRLRTAVGRWTANGCDQRTDDLCLAFNEDVLSAAEGLARAVLEGRA
jgi:hypothetical protein